MIGERLPADAQVFISSRNLGHTDRPRARPTVHTREACPSLTSGLTRYDGVFVMPRFHVFRAADLDRPTVCNRCRDRDRRDAHVRTLAAVRDADARS